MHECQHIVESIGLLEFCLVMFFHARVFILVLILYISPCASSLVNGSDLYLAESIPISWIW